MPEERRKHPRVPLSVDGRWQSAVGASLCRTGNISLGGCFARTPAAPPVNEPMLVTLFLGGRGAMLVKGHVARVEPGVGFGMRFSDLTPETRYRLDQEIAQIRRRIAPPRTD